MSTHGGRRYSWQHDHLEQESIPLRDHSPSVGSLQLPPNAGRKSPGDEGHSDQESDMQASVAQSHLQGQPGGM